MPKQTLLKAEILLITEDEAAQHYLFHKLGHYLKSMQKLKMIGSSLSEKSAYISYILDVYQRQLAKRYKKNDLACPKL